MNNFKNVMAITGTVLTAITGIYSVINTCVASAEKIRRTKKLNK